METRKFLEWIKNPKPSEVKVEYHQQIFNGKIDGREFICRVFDSDIYVNIFGHSSDLPKIKESQEYVKCYIKEKYNL